MGMYGGIGRAMDYNDRQKIVSERHNQDMAIGGARLNKYNYEESQRPVLEQREEGKYNQNMAIGKANLSNTQELGKYYADRNKFTKEQRDIAEKMRLGENEALLQKQGFYDLLDSKYRGSGDADLTALEQKGVLLDPVTPWTDNPDGSFTIHKRDGTSQKINKYQVLGGLKTLDARTALANKEKHANAKDELAKYLGINKIEQANERIEQGDARLGQGDAKLEIERQKWAGKTDQDVRKEIAAIDKDIDHLVISGVRAINPMTGMPYNTAELRARIREHEEKKANILTLFPNLYKKTTTPPPAVGGKPEPVYGAPSGAENPEPVSQDIKDGIEWINKNPNDPRAKAIIQKFREQGVIGI